ncbi:MAG: hydroxymethylglutaryl-CoA reductase [Verrucomicrobiota bacterium]
MSSNEEQTLIAGVPMQIIGPAKWVFNGQTEDVYFPLATYESPLWPSTNRGARVSQKTSGIHCTVTDERMTRSILVEAQTAEACHAACRGIMDRRKELEPLVEETSRFARLIDLHPQQVGSMLFLRLEFHTGDAAGHNMVTKASQRIQEWILQEYRELRYLSVSGNYCADKKVSAVNGILGRGKYVVSELTIPEKICRRYLKATPAEIVEINIKKNLVGSILAGGLRSANAHVANTLLAFYLATGQDAANIVEGSQGMTFAELRGSDLYFSLTLPNVIVGTVGNGKDLDFVRANLEQLGCTKVREPGENSRRLAAVCTAAALCSELSLLAALTNPGELMEAHLKLERA